MYEPFRTKSIASPESHKDILAFLKVHNPHLAENPVVAAMEAEEDSEDSRDRPMRVISNLGGYSAVFLPGESPSFVLKSAKSIPKVISLQGTGVRGMSSFHTAGCDRGFIYADVNGIARVSQLPSDISFDLGLSLQKIELGQAIHGITYHPLMESYVIGTSIQVPFELPKDDENRRDWAKEDVSFKPTVEQSFVKLISPTNWSTIDTFELDPCEMILCMKTLDLEVSEETHERRQLITVGTALAKGEDIAIKGRVYVFDVIIVVPEPGRPETNKKLKLIAKEEIPRGAVTAVSGIGTQGFMLIAQGQKCMVRGLKGRWQPTTCCFPRHELLCDFHRGTSGNRFSRNVRRIERRLVCWVHGRALQNDPLRQIRHKHRSRILEPLPRWEGAVHRGCRYRLQFAYYAVRS